MNRKDQEEEIRTAQPCKFRDVFQQICDEVWPLEQKNQYQVSII